MSPVFPALDWLDAGVVRAILAAPRGEIILEAPDMKPPASALYLAHSLAGVASVTPRIAASDSSARLRHEAHARLALEIGDDPWPVGALHADAFHRGPGVPLVLLTGCFDLIHAGHVRLIETAAALGGTLVVALLTTAAIRAQPKNRRRRRPLCTMADRLAVLRALKSNPTILFFDGPDSLGLIEQLRPAFFVKEQRDRGREIVEREAALVESYGGRVVWAETEFSHCSSTTIAEAILGPGA